MTIIFDLISSLWKVALKNWLIFQAIHLLRYFVFARRSQLKRGIIWPEVSQFLRAKKRQKTIAAQGLFFRQHIRFESEKYLLG